MRYSLPIGVLAGCNLWLPKTGPRAGTLDSAFVDSAIVGSTDDGTCSSRLFEGGFISIDESCAPEPVLDTFTPVIEWRNTDIGDAYTTPVVGRIYDQNGDGVYDDEDVPAVVVATVAGELVALAGEDGRLLWTVDGLGDEPMTAAIGDLDGDGRPEVVGSGKDVTIAVYGNGREFWSGAGASNGYCGAVAIADLDGDGNPEVILGSMILNGQTGEVRGAGAYGSGTGFSGGWAAAMGVAADIDQDGVQEAVVGNALYDADGNTIWYNSKSDGFVAVANFDEDVFGEIVVSHEGDVRLQDDDGTVLWNGSYTGSTSGSPSVADFDGDGQPEIGVSGGDIFMVIDSDGSVLWSQDTVETSSSGFTGSTAFDFEGDGAAEAVYADENDLYIFDGATGAVKLQESEHSSATCSEYPTVADVDNDGHAEIIYTSSAYSDSESGVRVVGDADNSWMSGRPVWNQYAYSITNVEEDATIPVSPDTNWIAGYNNFRSGDITPVSGSGEPDLQVQILDVCEDGCDRSQLTLWLAVINAGTIDVTDAFEVTLTGSSDEGSVTLDSFTWTDPVPSGYRSEAVQLEYSDVPKPLSDLTATVNGDGAIAECRTDNNTDTWGAALCR